MGFAKQSNTDRQPFRVTQVVPYWPIGCDVVGDLFHIICVAYRPDLHEDDGPHALSPVRYHGL